MKKHIRLTLVLIFVVCSLLAVAISASAADYDYTMTTDGGLSIGHSASFDFYYYVEDESIATVSSTVTTSMSSMVGPWGSSISVSKTATISPVKPGETKIVLRDNYGFTRGTYSLLVKEGKHQMETVKVVKQATAKADGQIEQVCKFCNRQKTVTVRKISAISLAETSYTYDGKAKTPDVVVKDSAGKALKKGTDYTVSYAKGRKTVGKYTVTVKLKGNYAGTKTLTFKINPVKVSSCSVTLFSNVYTYNGTVKTPTVIAKDAAGKKLKKDRDYTVTYSAGQKKVGTYKVTVKMIGNYSGTKVLAFKILPQAASINKLIAKSKAISVKLNQVTTQCTGYQIQYSTNSDFTSAKTVTVASYKVGTKTISGLKKNTKYYVRVRAYKTVDNKNYYANWSTSKSIKTK